MIVIIKLCERLGPIQIIRGKRMVREMSQTLIEWIIYARILYWGFICQFDTLVTGEGS